MKRFNCYYGGTILSNDSLKDIVRRANDIKRQKEKQEKALNRSTGRKDNANDAKVRIHLEAATAINKLVLQQKTASTKVIKSCQDNVIKMHTIAKNMDSAVKHLYAKAPVSHINNIHNNDSARIKDIKGSLDTGLEDMHKKNDNVKKMVKDFQANNDINLKRLHNKTNNVENILKKKLVRLKQSKRVNNNENIRKR